MKTSSYFYTLLFLAFLLPQILNAQGKTDICDFDDFVASAPTTGEKEARKDRYLKLIGVLQELNYYRQDFIAEGNFINLFPTAYYHTTHSEMLDIISQEFTYPVEKMQQMLAFYDAYKENRMLHDAGSPLVETHWKIHFDEASDIATNKTNFLCSGIASTLKTGITAHVKYDLPRAIRYAKENRFINNLSEEKLKEEFDATDKIFARTNIKTKEDIAMVRSCDKWWQDVGEFFFADFIPIYPNDATVVKWRKESYKKGMGNEKLIGINNAELPPQPVTHHNIFLSEGKKRCGLNTPVTPTPPRKSNAVTLFLLDVSGSMGKPAAGSNQLKIKAAADSGLRTVEQIQQEAQPKDVGVMTFSGACRKNPGAIQVHISNKLGESAAFFRKNIPTDGRTPLPQAIVQAQRVMEDHKSIRKFSVGSVVVLSDGESTCGPIRPEQVYAYQSTAATSYPSWLKFHTVGFDIPPGSPADRDLKFLAASSGGKYFNAKDDDQLTRAFQKLTQTYIAIPIQNTTPKAQELGQLGTEALLDENYATALSYWTDYHQQFPDDQAGLYNLAMAQEANEQYKAAIVNYKKYLNTINDFDEFQKIEEKIELLKEDYRNFIDYQKKILASDLAYLEDYYNRLFNEDDNSLTEEFKGFNKEKSGYYSNLPQILEINEPWLKRESKEVSRGLERVYKSIEKDGPGFVADAVAKLGAPVMNLRKLVAKTDKIKIEFDD